MKTITNTANRDKTIALYRANAEIFAEFGRSSVTGELFDYSRIVLYPPKSVSEEKMTTYLSNIQRGGFIKPFGCMIAIEEATFRIISYSENCFELLGLERCFDSKQPMGLIGVDVRTLFMSSSGASFAKAAASEEISLLNPVWLYSRTTQKPFYAILHRIDVGVVIDLEPARSNDHVLSLAGAVQSQRLAVRAISRLQSLPGGDIGVLCDTVVEEVQKLTGYDRVVVYKFHDEDHGEVVSENRRSDLEPYLGLHYPATDIPQAARFLFKQNRVRMICDCHANPDKVIQSQQLRQPLCLVNSTLRSSHECHAQYMANMGSVASLVIAVIANGNYTTNLWGLLVCHHTSPRHVPSPLRYACEFLMQAFGLHLHMEMLRAALMAEKRMLRTQTLLCDMLLRDAPLDIVTQSPSIMDLVKCDGAALYYGGDCWLLGTTQLSHRSEVQWGGAKYHPEDKDYRGKLNPRSSFKAFLELIVRESFQKTQKFGPKTLSYAQRSDTAMAGMDELSSVAFEMVRALQGQEDKNVELKLKDFGLHRQNHGKADRLEER
ncbi:hypothetical protein K1719_007735 [Acacia pycnantha]|nr:hypothetical protein K1719_007735 [Acacia pycnantha]